jgi:hypothetical protein
MQRFVRTLKLGRCILSTKSLCTKSKMYSFATTKIQNESLSFSDSFMSGSNAEYLETLFDKW